MCCRVGKCCFCISLRAGAITIACVLLVADALFLAWTSYKTHNLNAAMELFMEDLRSDHRTHRILLGAFWLSVVLDIIYSLAVLLDIMLLVGAISVRHKLLHGWMVAYLVVYIISLVINLPIITLAFIYTTNYSLAIAAVVLLHAGLIVYFWIVVRSYYLELGQGPGEGGSRSTPGKVYHALPAGNVPPGQGTNCGAGGTAMQPTALTPYATSPYVPLYHSDNGTTF